MELKFQIELTTNVILTKKILDIKLKKAKKEKEKLDKKSQAAEKVQGETQIQSPFYASERMFEQKPFLTNSFRIRNIINIITIHSFKYK